MENKLPKNLSDVLAKIDKTYGKGSIMMLGDMKPINENLLSSGSLLIDKVLGGGIGRGRITEIFGPESSGKTTLSLQFAAQCQKEGGLVAYIDVENAVDVAYAKKLGVDTDKLIFSQPNSGEQALDIAEMLVKTGDVSLIIVDSVAALTPQAELEGEMGDQNIGLLARLMGKAMRKLSGATNESNCSIIFINQIRDKINTGFSVGDTTTTTGGRALKFFASTRIKLTKTKALTSGADVVGNKVKIKTVKNKIAIPMQECEVPMYFGEGFSSKNEAISLGIEYGFIQKSGGWYTPYGETTKIQGEESVRAFYDTNKDKLDELTKLVKNKLAGIELEPQYVVDEETGEILED